MSRKYTSISQETTLSADLTDIATTANVVSGTNLMGGVTLSSGDTFTVVIEPETANEEIVFVTGVSTNSLTITRAQDSTTAKAHSAGSKVRHMAIGQDFRLAEDHRNASASVHGLGAGADVVGTTSTQTLTNKTLTSPTINSPTVASPTITGTVSGSGTYNNITVANSTITSPTITGASATTASVSALVLTGNLNANSNKIVTVATPTDGGDATNKTYVDGILGSATAAATSASAASASAAAASASAAAASASAAAASASAVAAAASESNAAASASAASASATAASASATAASASAAAASASAVSAASSASAAAQSAVDAAASAANAATAYDNFDDRYLGSKTADPTLDNDGNPLVTGALYFNSVTGKMRVYTGSGWIDASSASVETFKFFEFTASATQTTFSGNDDNAVSLSYTVGAIVVALNGVILRPGDDYTASNGSSIVLATGANLNDVLLVIAYGNFLVADTYSIAQADAAFVAKSTINAKGDLYAGTANDTVGVLSVGTEGHVLTASAGATTGLAWSEVEAGFNAFLLMGA